MANTVYRAQTVGELREIGEDQRSRGLDTPLSIPYTLSRGEYGLFAAILKPIACSPEGIPTPYV